MKSILLLLLVASSLISYSQYEIKDPQLNGALQQSDFKISINDSICGCRFIPATDFKEGMIFYFPRTESLINDDSQLSNYYFAKDSRKQEYKREKLSYKQIAGKSFSISKIESRKGDWQTDYYITLSEKNGSLLIEWKSPIALNLLKEFDISNRNRRITLGYAIYTSEIDVFKALHMGRLLYPTYDIEGQKFQKLKIVDVGAGTYSSPVRLLLEDEKGKRIVKDVVTCGTNIDIVHFDSDHFLSLFHTTDPKLSYKGSDDMWELICQSKIKIGMSQEDLVLSWGIPKKVNRTIVQGLVSEQWVYSSKDYVYVDNGVVKSFQSTTRH